MGKADVTGLDDVRVNDARTGQGLPADGGSYADVISPRPHRTLVQGCDGVVGASVWRSRSPLARTQPIVVTTHGWTDGALVYATLAGAVGDLCSVVAVDAPGHGWTPWEPSPTYSIPAAVPGLTAVVDAAAELTGSTGPIIMLGHSLGGLTVAAVAGQQADRIAHVILEDPVKMTEKPSRTLSRWRATEDAGRWLAWMTNMQALDHEGRVAWVADKNKRWSHQDLVTWAITKEEVDIAHLRATVDWGQPLVYLLGDVTAPVTLIVGKWLKGGISSGSEIRRVVRACRGGCQVIRFNAGHNARREGPTEYNATMRALLSRFQPTP